MGEWYTICIYAAYQGQLSDQVPAQNGILASGNTITVNDLVHLASKLLSEVSFSKTLQQVQNTFQNTATSFRTTARARALELLLFTSLLWKLYNALVASELTDNGFLNCQLRQTQLHLTLSSL